MCVSSSSLPAAQRFNASDSDEPVMLPTQALCLQELTQLAYTVPSRDSRPGGTEFYTSFTKSLLAVPKRRRSAKPVLSRAHTRTNTGKLRPEHIHPRSCGHDSCYCSSGVVVAMRDPHRHHPPRIESKLFQAGVHELSLSMSVTTRQQKAVTLYAVHQPWDAQTFVR
jgi:hypothetical protein